MKIKIFSGKILYNLEAEINMFIKKEDIYVIDIKILNTYYVSKERGYEDHNLQFHVLILYKTAN